MASLTAASAVVLSSSVSPHVVSSTVAKCRLFTRDRSYVQLQSERSLVVRCAGGKEEVKSDKLSGMVGRHFGTDATRDDENWEEGPGSDPVPKDGVITFNESSEDFEKVANSNGEGEGRKFGHDAARDEKNQEEGPGSDPVPKDGVITSDK